MWDETGLVLYCVEPAQYDLERGELDADRICSRVHEGGGNALKLVLHSEEGHVFFPSELAPLAPGYELGRDYAGEFAQACRRHGLSLACALSVAPNCAIADARPDWRQITPDGSPHSWRRLPVMCINTGYLTYITDLLREVVARYAPDCICLDNFALLDGCRCAGCASAFRQDTSLDLGTLGTGLGADRRYREWRFERTERLAWQVAMGAKSLRGDLAAVFSGMGWSPSRDRATGWRPERTVDWMDNVESGFALRWYGHDLAEGELLGAYHRALGRQGWVWVEYSPLPYTLLACAAAELRLKAATVLAGGGRPCVHTLPPAPPGDDSGLQPLRETFAQFAGNEAYLDIQGTFARTAVLLSRRAAEVSGRDTDDVVRGWCSALTQQHILWDFVLDRDVTREGLAHYRLLIIPSTPVLGPPQLGAIDEFVRRGGSALFVGRAGCFDDEGAPLTDFSASALLGVGLLGPCGEVEHTENPVGYLRVSELPLTDVAGETVPAGDVVPIRTTSAEVIAAAVVGPADGRSLPREDGPTWPGITWRMQGGGRVAYVASTLVSVLGSGPGPAFGSAERLVGSLARWLGGERLRVQAPADVAAQAYRTAGGATIHLVNRPEPGSRLSEGIPPAGPVEIVIPQTLYASDVRALDGTPIEWEQANRRLRFVVERVEEYCCVRVEGAFG